MAIKQVAQRSVTIESGQTESDPIDLFGRTVWAIEFPATMTGTGLTLKSGANEALVRNFANDADYTVTKADSKIVPLDLRVTASLVDLILVSSGSEGADRTFVLYLREQE